MRRAFSLTLLCLSGVVAVNAATNKPIRLRNEVINTSLREAKGLARGAAAPGAARSGLFLIQFTNTFQPAWRAQLSALGVDLLHYVPDDAFVARFDGVLPEQVGQIGFVHWVDSYRAEHKIHRSLQPGGKWAASESMPVAVLLSPRATEADARQAKSSLASVRQESNHRFGRVLRGNLDAAKLSSLAHSESVLWIEPAPDMRLFDEVSSVIVAGDGPSGQTLVQSLGYTGAGVTVAVADSGLDSGDMNTMHPDIEGRVSALFYYGAPGQLTDAADEHSHGTHVAGIIAGDGAAGETDADGYRYGLGVAPGSSLIGQRIFDATGNYAPPPSFGALTRDARRAGAEIGSNSWGDDTQGRYDISAMEFDALVRDSDELTLGDQPYILEFSAGNAGPASRTIGSPAVAKNVIASGAANSDRRDLPIEEFTIYDGGPDTMADFSSRGPCEDGRIKPDLVAPGSWIASLRSVYANDDNAWMPISDLYLYQGGTSQSGPHVSGAAAVFVQFYRQTHAGATPSPALVKAALINSATDMDDTVETEPVPNHDEGWGRVDLPALIASDRDYDFLDQSVLLTNDSFYEKRILVGSPNEPLKVTLIYTDVPGNPAAVVALVNDLDLEVVSPDGHLYRGNRFDFGESIPDAPGPDTINNVEAVHLFAPVPGEYLIRVRGTRVVEDARRETAAIDQDFAVVASAAFGTPGVGMVTFNRPAYTAPDQIQLVLVDYHLAGQPTVNVLVRSSTEPAGETLVLLPHGTTGLFTNSILTATGLAAADGKLQIAHSNVIEVAYADDAPAASRSFTARADLLSPIISNLQATNQFGQVVVSWTTDEDAKSVVYYGTTTLNQSLTSTSHDTTHEFALQNIQPNAVIKYMAVAEDQAGNRSTNNNGGAFFTITNAQPPAILLLDSYADSGLVATPPLSGYTDALDALGATYSLFDATAGAEPTPAQLQAHRCVIWRMDEISAPTASLAQKVANYVSGGGALLIASMEGVTRFTEAGLASFNSSVLQIQSFTEDQPVDDILGVPGDPVGAGLDTPLNYSPYEELLLFLEIFGIMDPSDWIVPTTNGTSVLLANGSTVGVRSPKAGVDLPGRVVYLSFPLDAVPMGSGVGNNRPGLLQNILNFLAPQPGSSSLTFDRDVYSVPGRALLEVEDADLQGLGQVNVTVTSPHQTNHLALFETAREGLFRGDLVFTATNTGLPGTLSVRANETVQASYFDVSASRTLLAMATIETNAPVISGVLTEPGYLEALVSWNTSEEADGLVQYSESPDSFPNNFTAYDPALDTYHELFLGGLKPNTTYYVRLLSRDRAGNTTVDDNHGQFHKFTTLQPRVPPWQDNMETNSVEWSTFTATDSESDWTRGQPGGGETANSPTNCWGSNLDGGPLSLAECYLISPGILLTGGNHATLRFWHNYDFIAQSEFDLLEGGQLEIITNVTTTPVPIAAFQDDASFGWEEIQLDLTPYLGNVVYIVWHYVLLSFDSLPRLGWLVDDASITVDTIVPSTIQITNNLWQAVFALNGPTGRSGNGRWTLITNAAPGQYVVQFGDVAFHQTPLPQTNNLSPGGTITFTGNYTFADVNTNGIPDGWEAANLGGVATNYTGLTDTDNDGLTDYAEYVAGTSPTNAQSVLELTPILQGPGALNIQWPAAPGHGYRLLGSDNLTSWSPVTDWIRASGSSVATNLPSGSARRYFRVEAQP